VWYCIVSNKYNNLQAEYNNCEVKEAKDILHCIILIELQFESIELRKLAFNDEI